MVTSITLGSFSQQNGRTVVSGSASGGLDTESLIEALTKAKGLPATQLEDRIETNTKLVGAYSTLKTRLNTFRDSLDLLRNPPGVRNQDENIFEYRSTRVGGNTALSSSNYLSVSAEPGASLSNYDITVDQLATTNRYVTNTFSLSDANSPVVGAGLPFAAGDFVFGANNQSVTFEDGDTLNEIVSKINAVKGQSKVEASILRVDSSSFRLSLKATGTGTDLNYALNLPQPPAFFSDATLHVDASDINGNGNYADNPAADQSLAAITDKSGNTTVNAQGTAPTLNVDGATNGAAMIDFSAGAGALNPANSPATNSGGPYAQKSLALNFKTGADVNGTQVIYEQGGASKGLSLHIMEDPANGNAPTLYAVVYDQTWDAGNQSKVLNLGTVTADTDYNVVLQLDASGNPTVNSAGNTFTGFVNGEQVAQQQNVKELTSHTGAIGIGGMLSGTRLADGSTPSGNGNYFRGQIGEVASFNRVLTGNEISQLDTYYDQKYTKPVGDASVFANVGFAIEEQALDAKITIDGTEITRTTNNFDDVIDGLSFSLLAKTGVGESLSLAVEPDTELVKSAILNFVDAYNAFRVFIAEQTELGDDGTPTEDALLASSSTLRTIATRVNSEITSIVDGILGGDYDRLADIGLSFEDFEGDEETPFTRNILVVDEAELGAAIRANFEQVRNLFEFDFTTTDPNLTVFKRTNDLGTTAIKLNVDQTNGVYTATYDNGGGPQTVNLTASPLSGGGVVLTGQDNTVLQGLQLIYGDSNDAMGIDITFTHGIGDRLYNTLDSVLAEDGGLLKSEIDSITETNSRYQEEITRINDIVERYREQLLRQFAALETAISQADLILQSINAQNEARLSAS